MRTHPRNPGRREDPECTALGLLKSDVDDLARDAAEQLVHAVAATRRVQWPVTTRIAEDVEAVIRAELRRLNRGPMSYDD